MDRERLGELLDAMPGTAVGVLGDFCLDAYWFIDESASERSLETDKMTRPVARQRYSLGGAGNVVGNLTALGMGRVVALGVVGDDLFGREMTRLLSARGADADGMLVQEADFDTLVYAKPHVGDEEQPRLDFGNFNRIADEVADALIERLGSALDACRVVIINEQVATGVHSNYMVEKLGAVVSGHQDNVFILDSRHRSADYSGVWLKVNAHEAAALCGVARPADTKVLVSEARQSALELHGRSGRPVFVSRAERGVLVCAGPETQEVPGIQMLHATDPVGAGDTMLAGIAAAVAAGATPLEAAEMGNFAASVTVRKLRTTGTANPAEVLAAGADPDYIYRPELAEDPRGRRMIEESEIVTKLRPDMRVSHVILDHDGTVSTLRQGWEGIMEPVMVRAILGPRYDSADESLYHTVLARVHDYINKSTGIQTLVQMKALADMVREFGCVPAGQIKDEFGYKEDYNGALMELVRARMARLERGELAPVDFTVKGAVDLLRALHGAGLKLYLASGTDQGDVEAEAAALGYAGLFEGRIYGAVGDITKEAKRIVLDRILSDIGPEAARGGLVTFGDGPVELRETHKRGGFAIGLATDEVRRFGMNWTKRTRLIRAGADLIIPDFSQLDRVLALLNIE